MVEAGVQIWLLLCDRPGKKRSPRSLRGVPISTTDRCGAEKTMVRRSTFGSSKGTRMLRIEEVLEDFRKYSRIDDKTSVDVTTRNAKGESPLHFMSIIGDDSAIELLCGAGAEVDARDNSGATPLWHAVFNIQRSAVVALIKFGADPELINDQGESPRRMIERCENLQWMRSLLDPVK